jgi:hypothetical protein
MAEAAIDLRFVHCAGFTSTLIDYKESNKYCMPFPPSHVECVTPDGRWLGQHGFGGMEARPSGYDHNAVEITADGRRCEIIVSLPCTQAQHDAFYGYMLSKIGMPYDWLSLLGFVLTDVDFHTKGHLVCSAIVTAGLRATPTGVVAAGFTPYLKWPLTLPFHLIDPATLFLMISSHVEIPH